MHRLLALTWIPALLACGSAPVEEASPTDIKNLVAALGNPSTEHLPVEERPESRLAAIGDPAIPDLREVIKERFEKAYWRGRCARALGMIWQRTAHPDALQAYLDAVSRVSDDAEARRLLSEAHRFRDPEGRTLALVEASLRSMRVVTPDMVAAAAAMSDQQSLETMMNLVGRLADGPPAAERDTALRYIGRAARHGRREAVEFLRACTQSARADLMEKAAVELSLLAGRIQPKSWSAWWFDHNRTTRTEWLAESFAPVGGKPFDPQDREHLAELVARVALDADVEPEMWYVDTVLGRRFGYVSPRDVFDPEVDLEALAASNRGAIETMRDWWRVNSPYLFFNSATGRFDISEEGRRIEVPVDPKTGKPGR